MSEDRILAAQRIADEHLLPAKLAVDRATRVPETHFQALAEAGLYGLVHATDTGGIESDDRLHAEVAERIASGCFTTAFVWVQHHGCGDRERGRPIHHARSSRPTSGPARHCSC